MISRFPGALARALLMGLLVLTPSLVVGNTGADTAQIVVLVAFFAAVLTFFEYVSTFPGLVEFRDAPPFNRIRFFSLFLMVLLISTIYARPASPSAPEQFVMAVGALIGHAMDFPYSPVRLIVLMLPDTAPSQTAEMLRSAAGLAYLVSLLSLAVFLITLRISQWPHRRKGFNVWVNLPTFDPTAGGDIVEKLERDARYNTALGFLLPFVTPPLVKLAAAALGAITLTNEQTIVWTIAGWAFLPASLFMRGIALQKVARMIAEQRQKNESLEGVAELQAA